MFLSMSNVLFASNVFIFCKFHVPVMKLLFGYFEWMDTSRPIVVDLRCIPM